MQVYKAAKRSPKSIHQNLSAPYNQQFFALLQLTANHVAFTSYYISESLRHRPALFVNIKFFFGAARGRINLFSAQPVWVSLPWYRLLISTGARSRDISRDVNVHFQFRLFFSFSLISRCVWACIYRYVHANWRMAQPSIY